MKTTSPRSKLGGRREKFFLFDGFKKMKVFDRYVISIKFIPFVGSLLSLAKKFFSNAGPRIFNFQVGYVNSIKFIRFIKLSPAEKKF